MKHSMKKQFAIAIVPLMFTAALTGCSTTRNGQATFSSPDAAVKAMGAFLGTGDAKRRAELFGADGAELVLSGDEVADRNAALDVKKLLDEKVSFEDVDDSTKVVALGNEDWPFPIPLEKDGRRWYFDAAAGARELENRRIGANELSTLATLHAIVDAQGEYRASQGRKRTYASKIISSDGKRDGLFWPTDEDEAPSPLGPLVADATSEGYTPESGEPEPYHGYYFRILTAQGPNAAGGASNYLDKKGQMSGGFAVVAWPAKPGNSGVMTFLIADRGIVFQKDLGADTAAAVAAIKAFDPDSTWAPTGD